MTQVRVAKATFKGKELADGQVWQRRCQKCDAIQPDEAGINQVCVSCGCPVVLWIPKEDS